MLVPFPLTYNKELLTFPSDIEVETAEPSCLEYL